MSKLSDGFKSFTLLHGTTTQTRTARGGLSLSALIAGVAACRREKMAREAPEEQEREDTHMADEPEKSPEEVEDEDEEEDKELEELENEVNKMLEEMEDY
jgi:hypothetical protein